MKSSKQLEAERLYASQEAAEGRPGWGAAVTGAGVEVRAVRAVRLAPKPRRQATRLGRTSKQRTAATTPTASSSQHRPRLPGLSDTRRSFLLAARKPGFWLWDTEEVPRSPFPQYYVTDWLRRAGAMNYKGWAEGPVEVVPAVLVSKSRSLPPPLPER